MTDYSKLARKITWVLFAAQSLASAGFIAAATINPILGVQLSGNRSWTGLPTAIYLLSGAFSASAWGYLMDRIGRRNGIGTGLLIGVAGNVLVLIAIKGSSFLLFGIGMVMMGVTNSAVLLGRFAAAEVNAPEMRGRAISLVVFGGAVGSILAWVLAAPMDGLATKLGMNELAGAYITTLVLFSIAAVVVFWGLKPDPRILGKQVAELYPESTPHGKVRPIFQILRQPAALVALIAMMVGQVVMVTIMVLTSPHMYDHHHMTTDIRFVISLHTLGMYAFSVISGRLVDQWGRGTVILIGASTLLLACILAPLSPDVVPLAVALFFLGLGWNFCFVGGSTLLADQLSPAERSRTQGANDLMVGLASAAASLGSGFIFAATSYAFIAIIAGGLAFIPIVMSLFFLRKKLVSASA